VPTNEHSQLLHIDVDPVILNLHVCAPTLQKISNIILPHSKNIPDTTKFNMLNGPQIQNTAYFECFRFSMLIISISQNCL